MNSKATPTTHRIRAVHIVVKDVADGVWKSNQAPDAQVSIELLTDMFAWTLAFHDVRLPTQQARPLSLNPLVLECGNREAGVFNLSLIAPNVLMANDLAFLRMLKLAARAIGFLESTVGAWNDMRAQPRGAD